MQVNYLKIKSLDEEVKYLALVIEYENRYYYKVKDWIVEITKSEYEKVIDNPYLYYFSTALKLEKYIKRIKLNKIITFR